MALLHKVTTNQRSNAPLLLTFLLWSELGLWSQLAGGEAKEWGPHWEIPWPVIIQRGLHQKKEGENGYKRKVRRVCLSFFCLPFNLERPYILHGF